MDSDEMKNKRTESYPNYEEEDSARHSEDGKIKFTIKGFLKYIGIGLLKVGLPMMEENVEELGEKLGEKLLEKVGEKVGGNKGEKR